MAEKRKGSELILTPGWRVGLSVIGSQHPLLLPVPVALSDRFALVVLLFAFGQGELALHLVVFPVQAQGHGRVALGRDRLEDLGNLFGVQQHLANAHGVGNDVGAGAGERRDVGVDQPRLAVAHVDVGIGELGHAGPHRLYFPAFQHESRLKPVFQGVVVPGAAVLGNRVAWGFIVLLLGHGRSIAVPCRGFGHKRQFAAKFVPLHLLVKERTT